MAEEIVKEAPKEVPQQMTLDAVLDDKHVEAPIEKPLSGKEAYRSTRQEHRDKEQEARGLERDPTTGQYLPKQPKEAPKEEVKPEVKAEVKPEVKPEVKAPIEEYTAREKAAFAKAADETRKRQALEKQLAELKKEPAKTFFEDPDGALARLQKETEEKINYATLSTRVQTSESIARSRYPDYDEKFSVFNELVKTSPFLAEQAFQSSDPAEFAYKTAKTHKDLADAGGVEKMKAKMEEELRAKVRAEIEAELKKKQEELEKERSELPGSLTDVPSKGVNRPAWGGPTSLENILKG